VITPNVDHAVRLLKDPAIMQPVYEGEWWVLWYSVR